MGKLKMPYFTRGTLEDLNKHLTEGMFKNLDRIIWHYVTEGEAAGQLILVYADKSMYYIHDTQLAASVSELAERVGANEEAIASLDSNMQTVLTTLEDIASWRQSVNESISNISGDVAALQTAVGSQGESIGNLQDAVAEHGSEISSQGSRLDAAEGTIDSHTATITSQGNTLADHAAAIETQGDALETQGAVIAEQAATIAAQGDALADNTAAISELSEKVDVPEMEGQTVPEYVEEKVDDLRDYVEQLINVDFI